MSRNMVRSRDHRPPRRNRPYRPRDVCRSEYKQNVRGATTYHMPEQDSRQASRVQGIRHMCVLRTCLRNSFDTNVCRRVKNISRRICMAIEVHSSKNNFLVPCDISEVRGERLTYFNAFSLVL